MPFHLNGTTPRARMGLQLPEGLLGKDGKGRAPQSSHNPHAEVVHRDLAPQSIGVGLHVLEHNKARRVFKHTSKPHLEAFTHFDRPRLLDGDMIGGKVVSQREKVEVDAEKKIHARGTENVVIASSHL